MRETPGLLLDFVKLRKGYWNVHTFSALVDVDCEDKDAFRKGVGEIPYDTENLHRMCSDPSLNPDGHYTHIHCDYCWAAN
jgi:hypothetical protein